MILPTFGRPWRLTGRVVHVLALSLVTTGCCRPVEVATTLGAIDVDDGPGCRDTGVLLTIAFPLVQPFTEVVITVDGGRVGGPFVLLAGDASLDPVETALLRFVVDAAVDITVRASVTAGASEYVASAAVVLVPGVLAGASLAISTCTASDGAFCAPDGVTRVYCDNDGYTAEETCTFGCDSGQCNRCAVGVRSCDSGAVIECPDGVPKVVESCSFACLDGACIDCTPDPTFGMTPECQPGDYLVGCDTSGTVVSMTPCVYGCNTDPIPERCNTCVPSMMQCIGDDLVDCDATGLIPSGGSTACLYGCDPSVPGCYECTPDPTGGMNPECEGPFDLVECNAMGVVVSTIDCSAYGCQTGTDPDSCNACTPSTTECQGSNLVTCNVIGAIVNLTACAAGCSMGACL